MSGFWKALICTAIPIVILGIIGMLGWYRGDGDGPTMLSFVWLLGVLYFVGAVLALIYHASRGNRSIMSGILAGLAIGFVSLGLTCFAGVAGS